MTTHDISFLIEEHITYTGVLKVDPDEFERVTGVPFAAEHLTDALLREYERDNALGHMVEERHGDVQGQQWSDVHVDDPDHYT